MITKIEVAWLAGILEGEGSFTVIGSSSNKQPMILMQSTDGDIVYRVAEILGGRGFVGRRDRGIKDATQGTYGKKPIYRYGVVSNLAIYWMKILFSHMGERRQARITEILDIWDSKSRRKLGAGTIFPSVEGFENPSIKPSIEVREHRPFVNPFEKKKDIA